MFKAFKNRCCYWGILEKKAANINTTYQSDVSTIKHSDTVLYVHVPTSCQLQYD